MKLIIVRAGAVIFPTRKFCHLHSKFMQFIFYSFSTLIGFFFQKLYLSFLVYRGETSSLVYFFWNHALPRGIKSSETYLQVRFCINMNIYSEITYFYNTRKHTSVLSLSLSLSHTHTHTHAHTHTHTHTYIYIYHGNITKTIGVFWTNPWSSTSQNSSCTVTCGPSYESPK